MNHCVGQITLIVIGLWSLPCGAIQSEEYTAEERGHWSLQPRTTPLPPALADRADQDWIRNPVDAFVLQRLRAAGLRPAEQAESPPVVRRLYLHLTGLPPTPEEVASFLDDDSPDAYERLVDRLLANPHYGEHWGQHWLDVVRFAETEGFEYDRDRAGAWRYRDYVVRSCNADKPYDRFITEQLAGDELDQSDEDALIAAGFYRLGPVRRNAGNTDVAFSRNEVLTEMTDSVGLVFLGLTVGCARCHDHMFDPVRQKDYYRLQAFLAATQENDIQLGAEADIKAWNALNSEVQAEIKKLREALNDSGGTNREQLVAKLRAAEKRVPAPLPTISSVKNDVSNRTLIHVLERGLTERRHEQVGPRLLGVLLPDEVPEFPPDVSKPKLTLARWITEPTHPLTARVIANRLWQFHFGRGLVHTPNDFGLNGGGPSHPELLDFLANELVSAGWQLKPLHRLILTSAAYRQASFAEDDVMARQMDPNNRLLWRFNRRRLTAEQLRDTMLKVSGRIDLRFGGPSILPPVEQELIDLLYAPDQWKVTADPRQHDRRSIYLIAKRNLRLPYLEVFDQPDLQISCSRRESSTHAPQSLELLNGRLANELAAAFAERLIHEVGSDASRQVDRAFELAVGRLPSVQEAERSLRFLATQPLKEFALAMFNINSFLYID
jgi:hypothetical protein